MVGDQRIFKEHRRPLSPWGGLRLNGEKIAGEMCNFILSEFGRNHILRAPVKLGSIQGFELGADKTSMKLGD